MNWILDHLQLVVIVASAFAWWWTQRRRGAGDEQESPPPGAEPGTPYEELERTRRIQDEIRRKIAQRQAPRTAEPPTIEAEAERDSGWRELPPPLQERPAPPVVAGWEIEREALERQQRLEQQMRALEAQRQAARATVRTLTAPPLTAQPRWEPERTGGERAWLQALRQPGGVRQAMVLREILGPPAGLR